MDEEVGHPAYVRFSTDALPERDRAGYWREVLGKQIFRLDVDVLADVPFFVDVHLMPLSMLAVGHGRASGTRERRTPELLTDGRDEIGIVFNLEGPFFVSQRGQDAAMVPGDGLIFSTSDLATFVRPAPGRMVGIYAPRKNLMALVPNLEDRIGNTLPADNGAGTLLRNYLGILETHEIAANPVLRRSVEIHILDLIALAVGTTKDSAAFSHHRGGKAAILHAIKQFIASNLGDHRLSSAMIADRHHLSTRQLQRLFEKEGLTVTEFVQDLRIARAFRLLSDPRHNERRVSAIAYECGFSDIPTFNRNFRRRYGGSPSDIRSLNEQN